MTSTSSLRSKMMKKRKDIEDDVSRSIFKKILEKFYATNMYKKSQNILAYYGKTSSGEFDTIPLLEKILLDGKTLYLPRCSSDPNNKLDIYKVQDLNNHLELGMFGLIEPKICNKKLKNIEDLDLIIVPGLVFDKYGMRLGYGGGFYDNLLIKRLNSNPPIIAFCYDFCLVDFQLQKKPSDVLIDVLITEKKCYNFSNR